MLKETALKLWDGDCDLNCSETIIYAANEEYNLNIPKEALKTMAGFGGGMATGGVCGTISGAVAVIGLMFTEERARESSKVATMTRELINRFKEEVGYVDCRDIKGKIKDADLKACRHMVEVSTEILESIVKKG